MRPFPCSGDSMAPDLTTAALAGLLLGDGFGRVSRPRPTAASMAAWDEYRRPGGHRSAKASAKANRKRKLEKQTRKRQRGR